MGVQNTRASRKNHPMPIEHVTQPKGRYTGAPHIGSQYEPSAPKKYRAFETTRGDFPNTPPPMSAEEPVRGEGPQRRRDQGNKGNPK